MKITLIYPCYKFSRASGVQEPLGLLYLASSLIQRGHEVNVWDLTFEENLDGLLADVIDSKLVGIYISTPMLGRAKEILSFVKSKNKNVKTIAGGPHGTYAPEEMLELGFDYSVVGEGEKALVEFIGFLEGKIEQLPQGVFGRKGFDPRKDYIQDLDTLPFPARHLIPVDKYIHYNGYVSVIATRGCPFPCIFCKPMQDSLFGKKIRGRSARSVIDEIDEIVTTFGCNRIYFKDDVLFALGKNWFEEFLNEREKRGLDFTWMALARVDQVDEQLLLLAKRAGLIALAMGVEAGSQRVLDFYQKKITIQQSKEAFALCHKHGILTNAYFMVGAPDETYEEAMDTVRLAKKLKPHSIRVFTTTPIPGHHLYELAKERDLIVNELPWEYYSNSVNNDLGVLPMKLKHLTREDVHKLTHMIRRVVMIENIKRCLTSWKHFRLALSNWRSVLHLVTNKL